MKKLATILTLSAVSITGASAAVTATNLLAFYDFNGNTNDGSGNGATGTLVAGATTAGAGYSGGGGDSSLELGTSTAASTERMTSTVNFASAITNNSMAVSFWQYSIGNGAGANIQSTAFGIVGVGAAARGFGAHTPWVDGTLYFDHSGCCGAANRLTAPVGTSLIDGWHHIVLQVDNGSKQIWIDGAMVMPPQATGAAAISSTLTGDVIVGTQFDNAVGFAGRIDEFAIWDVALEASEIQSLSSGAGTLTLIPEPSSGLFLILSSLLIVRRRR